MRKLGKNSNPEDKPEVKVEEASEQVEEDNRPKVFLASSKGKYSLFEDQKQLLQPMVPTEVPHEMKTADTKR